MTSSWNDFLRNNNSFISDLSEARLDFDIHNTKPYSQEAIAKLKEIYQSQFNRIHHRDTHEVYTKFTFLRSDNRDVPTIWYAENPTAWVSSCKECLNFLGLKVNRSLSGKSLPFVHLEKERVTCADIPLLPISVSEALTLKCPEKFIASGKGALFRNGVGYCGNANICRRTLALHIQSAGPGERLPFESTTQGYCPCNMCRFFDPNNETVIGAHVHSVGVQLSHVNPAADILTKEEKECPGDCVEFVQVK